MTYACYFSAQSAVVSTDRRCGGWWWRC